MPHINRFTVISNSTPPLFQGPSADYSQPHSDNFGKFLRRMTSIRISLYLPVRTGLKIWTWAERAPCRRARGWGWPGRAPASRRGTPRRTRSAYRSGSCHKGWCNLKMRQKSNGQFWDSILVWMVLCLVQLLWAELFTDEYSEGTLGISQRDGAEEAKKKSILLHLRWEIYEIM